MSIPATSPEPLKDRVLDRTVFQRYEFKYVVPVSLAEPIRAFLSPYCEMDWFAARESEKFYTVTTLYLDSQGYKTYWDKEQEVADRFKLRVRTYGDNCEGPVKFEVKRRINDVFRKTRVDVPPESWPALLTAPRNGFDRGLSTADSKALDDFIRLTRTLNARPKMLVRYQRQAFSSRIDRYVRISFDRRICYQPTDAYDLRGKPANWRSSDEAGLQLVLELKFMTRAPLWLVDLVRTFGLMRRGFSKYCTAVTRKMRTQ